MWFDYDNESDWTDDHPYDDDIEDTILAWKRLADSYSEEALILSTDLYHKLANIKCKKVLEDQMIRLVEGDFKDLKEILVFQLDKLFQRRIFRKFKNKFIVSNTENALTNENNESNQINHINRPSCRSNNDIETPIHAWKILAKSYSEKAGEKSGDLYKQLSKIKSKKVLKDQMIRLGKTLFHNFYFTFFSEEDFDDLKETLLFGIESYECEGGSFCVLRCEFEERINEDPNEGQCQEHMKWFDCDCDIQPADLFDQFELERLGLTADQIE